MATTDKSFFDSPSPVGDRDTRREALADYSTNLEDEATALAYAVQANDLKRARERLAEIKAWVDVIDDNLCERDEDGGRLDGGLEGQS